ncbi:MAG: Holliday junction branch migration protein RuvA [Eubacteriales bacterium]|nr:Holliday junction branch migration protein RuvA [Eubacteriales bacterium]
MYDYIKGTLTETSDDAIVVECAGIGYTLSVSYNSLIHFQNERSGAIKIYTVFSVRENAVELFGFADKQERAMFETLTNITKVGPKAAMSILSLYTPEQLVSIVNTGDVKSLTRAAGIGKKLAETVIFNLKDKYSQADSADLPSYEQIDMGTVKDEALMALSSLGFDRTYSIKLINEVYREGMDVEEIVGLSLRSAGDEK